MDCYVVERRMDVQMDDGNVWHKDLVRCLLAGRRDMDLEWLVPFLRFGDGNRKYR
jgi:hypothetical protein